MGKNERGWQEEIRGEGGKTAGNGEWIEARDREGREGERSEVARGK